MTENIKLDVSYRDITGKKIKTLRRTGAIPGIIYGHGFENIPVSVPEKQFMKVYREVGTSSIITIVVGNEKYDVLIYEVEQDPVSDAFRHVDFLRIRQDEKITTNIPVNVIGECSIVKELSGVLLTELDEIEIRCLPHDLPSHVEVDVSVITEFNEPLHVKDIKIPATIEVLTDKESVVVTVAPPKKEEEAPVVETQLIPEELKKEQEAAAAAQAEDKEGKKEKKE